MFTLISNVSLASGTCHLVPRSGELGRHLGFLNPLETNLCVRMCVCMCACVRVCVCVCVCMYVSKQVSRKESQ